MAERVLDSLTGPFAGLVLLHGLWIGLLMAGLTAILLRLIPPRWREAQHALLVAALLIAGAAPLAAAIPHWQAAFAFRPSTSPVVPANTSKPPAPVAKLAAPQARIAPAPLVRPEPPREAPRFEAARSLWQDFEPLIVATWLLVSIVQLARLTAGLCVAARRRRQTRPAPPTVQDRCDALSSRLGLNRPVRIHIDSTHNEPYLSGLWRPVILLPRGWLDTASPDLLDAVLAHELAHAHRGDLAVILAQRLIGCFWFFHPGVRWLSRMLDHRRERCADALAAELIGDPVPLALALESLARLRLESRSRRPNPLGATFGARNEVSLFTRIEEILGMRPARFRLRWWALGAIVGAWLLGVFVVSMRPPQRRSATSSQVRFLSIAAPASTGLPAVPADPHRRITYTLNFLTCTPGKWQAAMDGHRQSVEGQPEGEVWLIDSVKALIKAVQADERSNFIQLPGGKTFDGVAVTAGGNGTHRFVVDLEPKQGAAGTVSFEPKYRDVKTGIEAELDGKIIDGGLKLRANVWMGEVQSVQTVTRQALSNGKTIEASYQLPTVTEQRRQIDCTVPDGSALLIRLGCREREQSIGLSKMEEFVELLGGRVTPEKRMVADELLILIRPEAKILTDAELMAAQKQTHSRPR